MLAHLCVLEADVSNVVFLEVRVGLVDLDDVPETGSYNVVVVVGLGGAGL